MEPLKITDLLQLPICLKSFKTNILEDDLEELAIIEGNILISYKPFEVITLRLQL